MLNWIKNIFKSVCTAKNKIAATPVKTIDYLLNDPTTPEQGVKIVPPTACSLKLNVQGYVGAGYDMHSLQGQAASCYVTIQNTAKYLISQNKTKKTFTKWAATNTLNVLPRAGKDFNAYYDRSNLKFFYDIDTVTKKTVYTAESADIVSHEFGHAFLDILRPDLWNAHHMRLGLFMNLLVIFQLFQILCNMTKYFKKL